MHIRDKRSAEEEDDEDFTELSNLKKITHGGLDSRDKSRSRSRMAFVSRLTFEKRNF